MGTEENLGKKIEQAGQESGYDACAKKLLSERIVLAFILKYSVPEFRDCEIADIRDHYIEAVYVARRGIDVDESDEGADPIAYFVAREEGSEIKGQNIESTTKKEGRITYDIIFDVMLPAREKVVRLIINVEAQKSEPGVYSLVTRGVFYCGRMISAQKGQVFHRSDVSAK